MGKDWMDYYHTGDVPEPDPERDAAHAKWKARIEENNRQARERRRCDLCGFVGHVRNFPSGVMVSGNGAGQWCLICVGKIRAAQGLPPLGLERSPPQE